MDTDIGVQLSIRKCVQKNKQKMNTNAVLDRLRGAIIDGTTIEQLALADTSNFTAEEWTKLIETTIITNNSALCTYLLHTCPKDVIARAARACLTKQWPINDTGVVFAIIIGYGNRVAYQHETARKSMQLVLAHKCNVRLDGPALAPIEPNNGAPNVIEPNDAAPKKFASVAKRLHTKSSRLANLPTERVPKRKYAYDSFDTDSESVPVAKTKRRPMYEESLDTSSDEQSEADDSDEQSEADGSVEVIQCPCGVTFKDAFLDCFDHFVSNHLVATASSSKTLVAREIVTVFREYYPTQKDVSVRRLGANLSRAARIPSNRQNSGVVTQYKCKIVK